MSVKNLNTDDLRFIAKILLNDVDFEPKKYGLDELYLNDVRDGLIKMADDLEKTGEFTIGLPDDETKTKQDESEGKEISSPDCECTK